MGQRLVIVLDEDTTEKYLEMAGALTEAELNADCEPSGATIEVEMGLWGDTVYFKTGNALVEIGEAQVRLE